MCVDVVDHVIPLCAQPAFPTRVLDAAANMAWNRPTKPRSKTDTSGGYAAPWLQLGPDAYRDALVTYWTAVATLDSAAMRTRAAAELDGLLADSAEP